MGATKRTERKKKSPTVCVDVRESTGMKAIPVPILAGSSSAVTPIRNQSPCRTTVTRIWPEIDFLPVLNRDICCHCVQRFSWYIALSFSLQSSPKGRGNLRSRLELVFQVTVWARFSQLVWSVWLWNSSAQPHFVCVIESCCFWNVSPSIYDLQTHI